MTPKTWTEAALSEDPAVAVLEKLGYEYVPPEVLEAERETFKEAILAGRLRKAGATPQPEAHYRERRPRCPGQVTHATGTSLGEINQALHVAITHGVTVQQDMGHGVQGQTVRLIDFDDPSQNELLVTRQFKVKGATKHVIADAVVFVNGLPLAVLELKNPTLGDAWLHDAVDQLTRYQEGAEGYRDLGAPQLFETVQLLVATCGLRAAYGTVGTPQRFFAEWKTPYPALEEEVATALGKKPTPQDVALWGLFQPANLLDIVRNFVVFENDKKASRDHQQAPPVSAVPGGQQGDRPHQGRQGPRGPRRRRLAHAGVGQVAHDALARAQAPARPAFEQPDPRDRHRPDRSRRSDHGTFQPPASRTRTAPTACATCGSSSPARPGMTLTTTVQKFQDLAAADGGRGAPPVLNEPTNIFVLVDEAHRTQYRQPRRQHARGPTEGCFLGFTGTPIDKKDRSTSQTFGPYIDTYTIEQAVPDGATVPIFYESRLPELRIVGSILDSLFDRVFADRTEGGAGGHQAQVRHRGEPIAGAPKRIEAICLDLIEHYTKFIQPNGFKAQIVACSRDAAVTYKETLDRLNAPAVGDHHVSGTNDDEAHLVKHHTSDQERKTLIERFKKHGRPALHPRRLRHAHHRASTRRSSRSCTSTPRCREHTLLQAIARVNRTDDGKTYGLVVDYWGVSEALQEALAIFSPERREGSDEAEARRAAAAPGAARGRDEVLREGEGQERPRRVRRRAGARGRARASSTRPSAASPEPRHGPARSGRPALRDGHEVARQGPAGRAGPVPRRTSSTSRDCGAKVRKLIEEAIVADGIEILVKQVSLFSKEFDEKVEALKSHEAKASEMEHAIRARDPRQARREPGLLHLAPGAAREDHRGPEGEADRRRQAARAAQGAGCRGEERGLRGAGRRAHGHGLRHLRRARQGHAVPKAGEAVAKYQASRQKLAALVEEAIDPVRGDPGVDQKAEVQKDMRRAIKDHLLAAQVLDAGQRDAMTTTIVDVAKVRRGR